MTQYCSLSLFFILNLPFIFLLLAYYLLVSFWKLILVFYFVLLFVCSEYLSFFCLDFSLSIILFNLNFRRRIVLIISIRSFIIQHYRNPFHIFISFIGYWCVYLLGLFIWLLLSFCIRLLLDFFVWLLPFLNIFFI